MAPTASTDVGQALLDAAAGALTDTPERVFISHGAPAWEACTADQLTVHLAPMAHRQPRSNDPRMVQRMATWHVQLVRCVPGQGETPQAVPADTLDASAKALLADLDAIQAAVLGAGIWSACTAVQFGNVTPLGPQGNVAGWDWIIQVTL